MENFERQKEYRCEDCGEIVEENSKQCPSCNAIFEDEVEKKDLISRINKCGNTWMDILTQYIYYILFFLYLIFSLVYFIIGFQGGLQFAIVFSFIGTVVLSIYIFHYFKVGYLILIFLLIHKYFYHMNYVKIISMKKKYVLDEEYEEKIKILQDGRRKHRNMFIIITIAYILFFLIYLLFMNQIQSI